MSDGTGISWADATWSPLVGCTKVSAGCNNCYAIRTAHRMTAHPNPLVSQAYAGTEAGGEWTGQVNLLRDRLDQPLRWRKPRRIFVNAQSDLFHKDVPDDFIARVFAVMARTPHHTYQVLTKRHGRMRSLLRSGDFRARVDRVSPTPLAWPLPNLWLGLSVEDQATADLRIPALLDTPAAVRWVSAEPLLGPVNLRDYVDRWHEDDGGTCDWGHCDHAAVAVRRDFAHEDPRYLSMLPVCELHRGLDWVVVGGESGPGARPMHPAWARSLRDQCAASGVPYFFKQWGEHGPDGRRVGKRAAGDLLDGVRHHAYPDGLRDAGVLAEDDDRHVTALNVRVGCVCRPARLEIRVWEASEAT